MMKKLILTLVIAAVMLASLSTVAVAAPGGVTDPDVLKDLAAARQATARYQDVSVALADGYIPVSPCVESPAGGMGIHYLNPALAGDPAVRALTPELLLYAPKGDKLMLVGVEYFLALGPPGAPVPDPAPPAPTVFGQTMDGPMEGHDGGPPHYDLHVWLWQANPDGIFEEWNPNVHCP
jgi:hypothetical protein